MRRALLLTALALGACALPNQPADPAARADLREAADAVRWKPLLVADLAPLAPPPPPDPASAQAAEELAELRAWEGHRSGNDLHAIAYWHARPLPARWDDLAREKAAAANEAAPRVARTLALVHGAIHDAVLAAWIAKAAHRRAAPARAAAGLKTELPVSAEPSYPSEHAAAAYAAAGVLAHLYPAHGERMKLHAWGVAESRVAAGMNWRSDVTAGQRLGEAVAAQVVARAKADRSDTLAKLPLPTVPPQWTTDYPAEPVAGAWQPWLTADLSAYGLPAPPQPGEPGFDAMLAEVKAAGQALTEAQRAAAKKWTAEPPPQTWLARAGALVAAKQPPMPEAARTMAVTALLMADTSVATWKLKYERRLQRPAMADPTFQPAEPAPPHPAWPSDAAACATAAATYLAKRFPDEAEALRAEAAEAGMAGFWGGIQYKRDVTDGEALGREVAKNLPPRP